jgi:hypothetical protein
MRRLRIIFVLAVVAVALMSSPNAFADKDKDSPLMLPGDSKAEGMAGSWEIRCEGCSGSTTAICYGEMEECLGACESICGSPCGICQSLSLAC